MISRIAPLGLRTCSILAPGYMGIDGNRSFGNSLLGSSVGPVTTGSGGGAIGAATGVALQAASTTMHAASAAHMKIAALFTV